VVLAKQIATLDYLARGRCFPRWGWDRRTDGIRSLWRAKIGRGQRTDEAILLMRRLLARGSVTHEGAFFTCYDVSITPKPACNPRRPSGLAVERRSGHAGGPRPVTAAGLQCHAGQVRPRP